MTIDIAFDPVIVQLGPLQVGWHGLFTALAVILAVRVGLSQAERLGLASEALSELVVWALVGGVIGARLFHVLDHLPEYTSRPLAMLAVWEGGIAVYGAFIGGIAGGWLAARRLGLPPWPLLDAAAPAMLLGQAIGRLGCLSNGDAWGAPTGGGWGLVYTHPNALLPRELLGVPTHPYALYEIVATLLLLGGLWLAHGRLAPTGSTFLLAAVGYGLIRLSLSTFRQEALLLGGLQEAQLVGLVTGAGAALALVVRARGLRRALAEVHRDGGGGGG